MLPTGRGRRDSLRGDSDHWWPRTRGRNLLPRPAHPPAVGGPYRGLAVRRGVAAQGLPRSCGGLSTTGWWSCSAGRWATRSCRCCPIAWSRTCFVRVQTMPESVGAPARPDLRPRVRVPARSGGSLRRAGDRSAGRGRPCPALPLAGVRVTTLRGALEAGHLGAPIDVPASSWGSGKDFRVWTGPRVAELAKEPDRHPFRTLRSDPARDGRRSGTGRRAGPRVRTVDGPWGHLDARLL